MRVLICCLVPIILFGATTTAGAQDRPPARQRHQYVPTDPSLDSASIQITVRDHATGAPLPALICLDTPRAPRVVTGTEGVVRISNLRRTNTTVRVLASGYDADTLIFQPGMRGRSQAEVQLIPNASASSRPTCELPRERK